MGDVVFPPSYRFTDGRWEKCEPPQWFTNAREPGVDWDQSLFKAGATLLDDIGGDAGGDSIAIYRRRNGEWCRPESGWNSVWRDLR